MQNNSQFYGFSGGKIRNADGNFFDFLGNNWQLYNEGGYFFHEQANDFQRGKLVIHRGRVHNIGASADAYVKEGIPVFLEDHIRGLISRADVSSADDPGRTIARCVMEVSRRNPKVEHGMLIVLFNRGVINGDSSLRDLCCILPYKSDNLAKLFDGVNVVSYRDFRQRGDLSNGCLLIEAQKYANTKKAYGSVIVDNKEICRESTGGSLFCFYESNLCTSRDKIPGEVMRGKVVKVARDFGIRFIEGEITYDGLLRADEVFITHPSKLIIPVTSIDGKVIGRGNPGRLTMEIAGGIMELMDEYVKFYRQLS